MTRVQPTDLPPTSLLCRHQARGAYADCYTTVLPVAVLPAQYIEAFYTTALFKAERRLIALVMRRPSSDADARALARGTRQDFAAWRVEDRTDDQIMLADLSGKTRSWLMAVPAGGAAGHNPSATRLYFGSAVLSRPDPKTGQQRLGFGFHALLGAHKLYSRLLLRAAAERLQRLQPVQQDKGGVG